MIWLYTGQDLCVRRAEKADDSTQGMCARVAIHRVDDIWRRHMIEAYWKAQFAGTKG
jgi:hypothetical protein